MPRFRSASQTSRRAVLSRLGFLLPLAGAIVFAVGSAPAGGANAGGSSSPGAPEPQAAVTVVAVGDPTPLGGVYAGIPLRFGAPALAPGDGVLFQTYAEGTPPRTFPEGSIESYVVLWRYRDGSVEALAVWGDPVPALDDPGTAHQDCWLEVHLDDERASNGTDVVLSTVARGSTCFRGGYGLFLVGGGPARPFVMKYDASPAGSPFSGFGRTRINAAGAVLFGSTLEDGRGGLFLSSGSGIAAVAVEGAATPIGSTYRFIYASPRSSPPGRWGSDLNDDGDVVFFATTDAGGEAIFAPGRKIVASGDPAPGGGTFARIAYDGAGVPMSMNGDGVILFNAQVRLADGTLEEANFVTTFTGGLREAKRLPVPLAPVTPISDGGLVVFGRGDSRGVHLYRVAADGTATSLGRLDPSPYYGDPIGVTTEGDVLVATSIDGRAALVLIEPTECPSTSPAEGAFLEARQDCPSEDLFFTLKDPRSWLKHRANDVLHETSAADVTDDMIRAQNEFASGINLATVNDDNFEFKMKQAGASSFSRHDNDKTEYEIVAATDENGAPAVRVYPLIDGKRVPKKEGVYVFKLWNDDDWNEPVHLPTDSGVRDLALNKLDFVPNTQRPEPFAELVVELKKVGGEFRLAGIPRVRPITEAEFDAN